MAVQGFGNSPCGIWAAEFELNVKQALLPAGPWPHLCQLSKCLPAACCQAGACRRSMRKRIWSWEWTPCVEFSLCSVPLSKELASKHLFKWSVTLPLFTPDLCLLHIPDTGFRWNSMTIVLLSTTAVFSSWYRAVSSPGRWRAAPAEGLPLQISAAGEVSPIQELVNQADSTATSMKNVFTPLSRSAAIREDPMEMGVKPCSKQPSGNKEWMCNINNYKPYI